MKYVIYLVLLVSISLGVSAQVLTEFPTTQPEFLKEVEKYMKDTKRDDCKETVELFLENVEAGKFNTTHMERIITSSNIMLEKKLRANPYYREYLDALNFFASSGKPADVLIVWSDALDNVMNNSRRGSTKDFSKYIEFSTALFRDNTFYSSRAKNWRSTTDNWKLVYDTVPKVIFPTSDLIAYSSTDTARIYNTSGTYFILEERWVGKGGKVNWESVDLKESEAYATIDTYTIDMNELEYQINNVTFNYPEYFDGSIPGNYINKLTPVSKDRSYPRFISDAADLKIYNFSSNIQYEGEFALFGREVSVSGTKTDRPTFVFLLDNGTKILRARPRIFTLRENGDVSLGDATAALYIGSDSIYHPGVKIVYKIDKKELSLYKGDEGISSSDFFDSYHNMEIDADQIIWNLDENKIDLKMVSGAGQKPATFRSANFFMKGELEKMQAPNVDYNPVSLLKIYCDENNTTELYADAFARQLNPNFTEGTIKGLLFRLVEEGYIYYNEEYSLITVRDKTFNYVLAHAEKIDYDALQVNSFSTRVNGQLDLENFDIDLVGVKQVTLSDSQNVMIFPKNDSITLQKEQDLFFSGVVFAGNIDFDGNGFLFDYEKYQVDLTQLASAVVYVETDERDKDGEVMFKPMTSRIEGLTGYLEIDEPDNKSGRKPNPQYPIYNNLEISYVYYERIHDSAYVRDHFYFEIDPFVFDSLARFDPYLSDLEGSLISADIFPNFREKLHVQKDLSWGFRRDTPDEGFPLYKGIGTYTDEIWLSNAGLRGKGKIDYLFTKIESDSIIFFPDSMDAVTDSFNIKKTEYQGATFPIVKGIDNDIHWLPYRDSMFIKQRTVPFEMYEIGASMKGALVLTTKGLKGDGAFEFKEASLTSNQFNFEQDDLWADTMGLAIKAIDADKATFETPNVNGKVDLANKLGTFKANEEDIAMEFANNQYVTAINEFFWDMEANRLDFKSPPGSEGSYFTSIRADQDSLKFLAKEASFDMSNSIIEATSVPEVLVADASIVPDSNKVTILPGGLLDSLNNAVIVADTATKMHRIYDAELKIHSRNKYTGTGTYDYAYRDGASQPIYMTEVGVKEEPGKKKTTLYKTFANGMIEDTANFMLHPAMQYKGVVDLNPGREHLTFTGFGRFRFEDTTMSSPWFTITDEIDPANIVVHYENPVDDYGDTLEVGFNFDSSDSISLYPLVMEAPHYPEDQRVLTATGISKYNSYKKIYTFGDSMRINGQRVGGNVLEYYEEKGEIVGRGNIDLGLDLTPVEIITAGKIEHVKEDRSSHITTLLGFNLPIDKTLLEQFAKDINAFSFDRPFVDYSTEDFESSLACLVDPKKEKKELEELRKTGQLQVPKELSDYNLIFSNVKFYYDPVYQIYRSKGPLGLSYAGETGIHRQMVGYIEFGMRSYNDFFNIYIESSFDDWYYFTYNNKTLQIASSNEDFNKMLAAINPEKRKIELNEAEVYFYTVSSFSAMQSFLNRMKQIEAGTYTLIDFENSEQEAFDEIDEITRQLMEMEDMRPVEDDVITIPEGVEEEKNDKKKDQMEEAEEKEIEDIFNSNPTEKKDKKKGKEEEVDPIQEMFNQKKREEELKKSAPQFDPREEAPMKEEPVEAAPVEEEPMIEEPVEEAPKKGKKNNDAVEEDPSDFFKSEPKEETKEESPAEEAPTEESPAEEEDGGKKGKKGKKGNDETEGE